MNASQQDAIDAAVDSVTRLRSVLNRNKVRQVTARGDRDLIRATVEAWVRVHKPALAARARELELDSADAAFVELLTMVERATKRTVYLQHLKTLKEQLVAIRTRGLTLAPPASGGPALEAPPDFSPLVGDPMMRRILDRRWRETQFCVRVGADLAATVMMGGLLEGLFVARVNGLTDKAPLFTAAAAPKDSKTGKPLGLKDWTLKNYIDVSHQLGWINTPARDISVVLRDYRNYIHPEKEYSSGKSLDTGDSAMFWTIFTALTRQILTARGP
jgi:hypothetical protein